MRDDFCKVFHNYEYGQILVKIDESDEGTPEVRFYASPENLGVCSVAAFFTDDDEGWERAKKAFEKSDEAFCVRQLERIFKIANAQ